MSTGQEDTAAAPLLRVVKGDPSPEELAALVAVVAAHGAASELAPPTRRSAWGDPSLATRPPHAHGHDGWRRSAFAR
ncbi:acyl-CoA carboxylase subunit epsilon [Mumia sp. zg.B53]|uniref:acyl-CoA carboxylase subunit epsilon n=1 Tax=unclassified Mumia TaxID=2621872 RepID=UPI001C6E0C07|nr:MULTISPECIES: acyl-CoA carboxylase subunit epsilon [unclassified Mumia]MBW9204851.1 acyl-CoA carboxylase subunit epsilon [Mumia sp. zg.B17]MBW9209145.1 acyl-CoA carboxylase subunit epsilon [Mumia sp. zg.B21]MBW9213756.1 acyl-CoA carboxylase subunit epsilon [Mumia sp. zg.B53]MDD9349014.1 acyl-CoA carboxylase subunit epsilon [Mumia sp.]